MRCSQKKESMRNGPSSFTGVQLSSRDQAPPITLASLKPAKSSCSFANSASALAPAVAFMVRDGYYKQDLSLRSRFIQQGKNRALETGQNKLRFSTVPHKPYYF